MRLSFGGINRVSGGGYGNSIDPGFYNIGNWNAVSSASSNPLYDRLTNFVSNFRVNTQYRWREDPTQTMVEGFEEDGAWTVDESSGFFRRANIKRTTLIGSGTKRALGRNALCSHSCEICKCTSNLGILFACAWITAYGTLAFSTKTLRRRSQKNSSTSSFTTAWL